MWPGRSTQYRRPLHYYLWCISQVHFYTILYSNLNSWKRILEQGNVVLKILPPKTCSCWSCPTYNFLVCSVVRNLSSTLNYKFVEIVSALLSVDRCLQIRVFNLDTVTRRGRFVGKRPLLLNCISVERQYNMQTWIIFPFSSVVSFSVTEIHRRVAAADNSDVTAIAMLVFSETCEEEKYEWHFRKYSQTFFHQK